MTYTRWHIKKTTRYTMAVGSALSGYLLMRRLQKNSPRLRVLTYHRIGHAPRDPFYVSPDQFEAQMRLLATDGRAVSVAQVKAYVNGDVDAVPPFACLVTIDDGMLSTMSEALPILAKWKVPAVAYVSSSLVGRDLASQQERYLTWEELRQVAASNVVSIGSHAHSHRSLGSITPAEAAWEISHSREVLQQNTGFDIETFAYPFGTRGDFNRHTEAALQSTGYSLGFNSIHGPIGPGMRALNLPRIKIEGGESLPIFSLISRGGMDGWRMVDHALWRLQRARHEIL